MAVSRINEAGLNINQYGNRNLVINGAMQVAQRGTVSGPDRVVLKVSAHKDWIGHLSRLKVAYS